jgi:AcrR family transcriptional regulator
MSKTNNATVQASPVGSLAKDRVAGRPTGRVSKSDWLDKALEVLVSEGIDAVRVVDLARQLNISKSGFYWHFQGRADLLEAMKRYWVDEFSRRFIDDVNAQNGPLRERLISLIRAIRAKQSGKLDLAFTAWAQKDTSVQDLVEHVRDMRVAFVKDLLSATGIDDKELASRAKLFVVYFSWSEVMFEPRTHEVKGEDLNTILDIITGEDGG